MTTPPRRPLWLFTFPVASAALGTAPLAAAPVTVAFRGTVADATVLPHIPGVPAVNWPAVGTTFEGTYTFETTAPDTASHPFMGAYVSSPGEVHATAGGFRWHSPDSLIDTTDSGIAGAEELYSAREGPAGMRLVSHPDLATFFDQWDLLVTLRGNGSMLNGPQLPPAPPSLETATVVRGFWLYGDHSGDATPGPVVTIRGSIDSLTVIPEPATCGTLCAALAWALSRRARRTL
jgi:hypothetical protein